MPPSASAPRPQLADIKTSQELNQWYWLKTELVAYAKQAGLPTTGTKPELQQRLAHWLDTGQILPPPRRLTTAKFDWSRAALTLDTVITDNYRNTRNVRTFMQRHVGSKFAFSNEFMAWMRSHEGKTLRDAIAFWQELHRRKTTADYREAALPQNQYAQFVRAISQAHPGISASEIRRIWYIKRSQPAPHSYQPGDENL